MVLAVKWQGEVIIIYSLAPGEVRTFAISQPPDTAERLDLVVVCPEERQRNGPIAKFTYTSTVDGDTQVTYEQMFMGERDTHIHTHTQMGEGGSRNGCIESCFSTVTRVTHLRCRKEHRFVYMSK